MDVLIYLLPMALGLGLTGLFAFLWSLKNGQYEDMDGAPLRVLSDEDIDQPDATPERTDRARRSVSSGVPDASTFAHSVEPTA